MTPALIRHLEGERLGRFPVWMMRQAGRYLPRYRAIREKHSFWEMATTPAITAEVSLLPLEQLSVDGVIFFADILTLPHGLGVPIEMKESVGPVTTTPLRATADFDIFAKYDPKTHNSYVGEALDLIRRKIPDDVALLGFAGAPWTVACYLVEGKLSRNFETMLKWVHTDPAGLAAGLSRLADATIAYLKLQRGQGAHVVQLFDTWASAIPRPFFVDYYLPLLNHVFSALKPTGVKRIYFAKHAHHLLPDFARLDVDLLSCDALLPLAEFEKRTGSRFSLQGNLDPVTLFADVGVVRRETRKLVQEARTLARPAILNLGHGILPGTPVETVKAFVDEARTSWL